MTNTSNNLTLVEHLKRQFLGETILSICEKQINIPQLSVCNRNEPLELKKILALFLADLNDSLGVKRGLTPKQLDDIVELFPLRFPFLRINDVYLICQFIKSDNIDGFQIMDRLDVPTFFMASKIYESKKGAIQSEYLEKLHKKVKEKHRDDALNIDDRIKSDMQIIYDEQKRHDEILKNKALNIRINKTE